MSCKAQVNRFQKMSNTLSDTSFKRISVYIWWHELLHIDWGRLSEATNKNNQKPQTNITTSEKNRTKISTFLKFVVLKEAFLRVHWRIYRNFCILDSFFKTSWWKTLCKIESICSISLVFTLMQKGLIELFVSG